MSGDLYKIAVGISLQSNHAGVLGAMAAQLIGLHGHVNKLHEEWGRVKLAMAGGLALGGSLALIGTLKHITDHARELSKELATLKTQGLNDKEIGRVDQRARQVTQMVPGSTEAGNLKLASEAYSLMGVENAKKALPVLSSAVQVFGAIDGNYKQATESLYSMLKSGEMVGKLMDEHTQLVDPAKLTSFLDVMAKVSAATGNKVNAKTLFGMVQQGAPALANMDNDGLTAMLMAAQQMGGPRAGTALTSLYQQFVGGTMTEARAKELHRLGLVGDYDVGRGGHLTFKKGALDTDFAKSLEHNPLHAMEVLKGAMEKGGFTTIEAQTKELFMLLGRQTTQRLVSDFLRNMTNMGAEQERIKGGQGLDDQAKTRNSEDYAVVEHNLYAAWDNLTQAISGPNAKAAIGIMHDLTSGLNSITTAIWAMDPQVVQQVGRGLALVGVALTGAGAAALLAAIGPVGWLVGGVVGTVAAFASVDPSGFKATMLALKDTAVSVYGAVKDFVADHKVLERLSMFWAFAKSEALIIYNAVTSFKFDPAALVGSAWAKLKETLPNITDGLEALGRSIKVFVGFEWGLLKTAAGFAVPAIEGLAGAIKFFVGIEWTILKTAAGWMLDALKVIDKVIGTLRAGGNNTAPGGAKPGEGTIMDPRFSTQSFEGSGFRDMIHNIALGSGSGGASSPFAEGVYQGVLRAMQELMGKGGGGPAGGGGFQNASFTTGGGANDNFGSASGVARALGRGGAGGGSDGGIDRGGINAVGGSNQTRAHYLMGRLIAKGWTPEAAAAAAGNAVQESGVRPFGVTGDHGTAHGIFQWRLDRWQAAQAYMRAHPNQSAMDAQIDFFDLERKRRGGIQAQMHTFKDVGAANRGMRAFERYGDESFGTRGANARGLLRSYSGAPSASPPTAGPPPRPKNDRPIMVDLHMDGRKMGRAIAHHQAEDHRFPLKAGGTDNHGEWRAPGTPVMDAA